MRDVLGLAAFLAVALGLAALTFSATTEPPADFTFVNGAEPQSLDPHVLTGQAEGRIATALFEGLLVRDPRTLEPVPGVARALPEVRDDGLRYVFHLRPQARWSDGTPVTAHDFAWSWRRLEDPRTGASYAYILHMIRGAEVFNTYLGAAAALRERVLPAVRALRDAGKDVDAARWQALLARRGAHAALKGVADPLLRAALVRRKGRLDPEHLARIVSRLEAEAGRRERLFRYAKAHFGVDEGVYALDAKTLVVDLVSPTPYFLEVVTFYPTLPVPRHRLEGAGDVRGWFLPDRIVSNGPFRLAAWRVHDRIRLVKSRSYWDAPHVRLGTIDALSLEDATTALNLYLTGEAEWLPGNYPRDLVDALRDRPDFYAGPGMMVYYYRFNTTRPPFDDPRVRLAVCLAVDRQLIVDKVLRLGQLPATHFVPPGLPGYRSPPTKLRFDVAKARRLLAEAGYPNGRGWPKNVGLLYNTSEDHKKLAEVVADQLRRNLGIEVGPYNEEWQAYQASSVALDYDMARAMWIGDYLDPNTFLDLWVTNGGNNRTGWGDPRYDALIAAAGDPLSLLDVSDGWLADLREPDVARGLLERLRGARAGAKRRKAAEALRLHLFREAEAILFQEAFPIFPLYFYVASGLVKPWVRGFHSRVVLPDGGQAPNLQDIHPLRGIWIEHGAGRNAP
ncbi:MAG: peptide ABC transporter substrate-binding protein [Planctomycetota bacterium]